MSLVQQVINVVIAFAQDFFLQAFRLMRHSLNFTLSVLWCAVPCHTKRLTDAASLHLGLHFEHTELVDMQFGYATDSVVHWVNVGAVRAGDMNCDVACSINHTVSRSLCVRPLSCWMIQNSHGSYGTRMCKLVCRSEENILSKFCNNVNNWLNVYETI